jgi:hypothetical protein
MFATLSLVLLAPFDLPLKTVWRSSGLFDGSLVSE